MKLNEKILILRKKEGWSQEELAFKLDVSRQAVYKWESGDSMPEIEKIKMLAKVFNVSFDYLMDDEVETIEKPTKKVPTYRCNFNTTITTNNNLSDIDCGIGVKRKVKPRENDLFDRQDVTQKALKEIGATDIEFLDPYSAMAYFYVKEKRAIGFYYAGAIQFMCPIENIVSFGYSGGEPMLFNDTQTVVGLGFGGGLGVGVGRVPTVSVVNSSWVELVLNYRTKDEVKQFKMQLTANTTRALIECKKRPQDFDGFVQIGVSQIKASLNRVQNKVSALRAEADLIRLGEIEVEDIDYAPIKQKNKETAQEYSKWVETVKAQDKQDNKKNFVKKLLIYGGLILGLFIAGVIAIMVI